MLKLHIWYSGWTAGNERTANTEWKRQECIRGGYGVNKARQWEVCSHRFEQEPRRYSRSDIELHMVLLHLILYQAIWPEGIRFTILTGSWGWSWIERLPQSCTSKSTFLSPCLWAALLERAMHWFFMLVERERGSSLARWARLCLFAFLYRSIAPLVIYQNSKFPSRPNCHI